MGCNIYYGNLADATTDTADINDPAMYSAQYPMSNVNVLNRNIYSDIDYGTTDIASSENTIVFFYCRYANLYAASSFVYDFTDMTFTVENANAEEIGAWEVLLQGMTAEGGSWVTIETITLSKGGANGSNGEGITTILDGISAYTFSEVSYRIYRLALHYTTTGSTNVAWNIAGQINNLYLGDYLALPDPDFYPRSLTHNTKINTSYTGLRSGQDTQGQRKAYNMVFDNLSETEKNNIIAFDSDTGGGAYPVYFEHTSIIDAFFARIIGGLDIIPTAYQNYRCAMNIEEEL